MKIRLIFIISVLTVSLKAQTPAAVFSVDTIDLRDMAIESQKAAANLNRPDSLRKIPCGYDPPMQIRPRPNVQTFFNVNTLIVLDDKVLDVIIPKGFNFAVADEAEYARLVGIKASLIKEVSLLVDASTIKKYGKRAEHGVVVVHTSRKRNKH